jgi:hypothetical protein
VDDGELSARLMSPDDLADLVDEAAADPSMIKPMLEMAVRDTGSIRYRCTKVVRLVSELTPESVYPFFDDVASLIQVSNSFIKWDGITIIANLAAVDRENRFASIKQAYFGLIQDRQMISAANVIGHVWKIVQAKPELEPEVTSLLLGVPDILYFDRGKPSPECNRVACGHVLDCFDRYFGQSGNQAAILDFARAQLASSRPAVAKKAMQFLARHGSSGQTD